MYLIQLQLPTHTCELIIQFKTFLLVSAEDDVVEIAAEAMISLIASPNDYENEMIAVTLQNYFLRPRYLHVNDVFSVDPKEYAQDRFYSCGLPTMPVMCFLVKSLKTRRNRQNSNVNSCYVLYGESTLIQQAQIHSYIPRRLGHSLSDNVLPRLNEGIRKMLSDKYPAALMEPLECLESCINPFLKRGNKNINLNVYNVYI